MFETAHSVLTVLIFFPLAACLGLILLRHETAIRYYTLGALVLELALAMPLLGFDPAAGGFQFVQKVPWVEAWGLFYHVGLDGISLFMVGPDRGHHAPLRIVLLALHQPAGQGVSFLPAVYDQRLRGRLLGPGFCPLLHLLGSHAGSHVSAHRRMGRTGPALRLDQVFSLHPGRFPPCCWWP